MKTRVSFWYKILETIFNVPKNIWTNHLVGKYTSSLVFRISFLNTFISVAPISTLPHPQLSFIVLQIWDRWLLLTKIHDPSTTIIGRLQHYFNKTESLNKWFCQCSVEQKYYFLHVEKSSNFWLSRILKYNMFVYLATIYLY